MYDNHAYILELKVAKDLNCGIQIKDIKLPKKCFLGLIIRDEKLCEAKFDMELQVGDG